MSNIARDVFKDFDKQSNILDCIINNINLYKKSKKIGIELVSENKINILELSEFEEYLKQKFEIEKIEFNITYTSNIDFTLEKDWNNIINYITLKMPITKPMIQDSTIKTEEEKVYIILKTHSLDFLKSYKFDKALERLILNLYGKKYNIKYEEIVDLQIEEKQSSLLEEIEKEECEKAIAEQKEYNRSQKVIQSESKLDNAFEDNGEKQALILGRSDKIKEQIVKIADLTTDYGKVAIEGKVISTDSRELKNGKTLAMFNIYDGTSTITCKSFLDPDKKDKVLERLQNAKRLKLQGNVGYDNFAKEIRNNCKCNSRNARHRNS